MLECENMIWKNISQPSIGLIIHLENENLSESLKGFMTEITYPVTFLKFNIKITVMTFFFEN